MIDEAAVARIMTLKLKGELLSFVLTPDDAAKFHGQHNFPYICYNCGAPYSRHSRTYVADARYIVMLCRDKDIDKALADWAP